MQIIKLNYFSLIWAGSLARDIFHYIHAAGDAEFAGVFRVCSVLGIQFHVRMHILEPCLTPKNISSVPEQWRTYSPHNNMGENSKLKNRFVSKGLEAEEMRELHL